MQEGIVKDIYQYNYIDFMDSIIKDYPDHLVWLRKISDRKCWYILSPDDRIIALLILKIESDLDCSLQLDGSKILKICLIKVISSHRNLGIGQKLFEKCKQFCNDNSLEYIYTICKNKDQQLQSFLRKFGFSESGLDNNLNLYLSAGLYKKCPFVLKDNLNKYAEVNQKAYDLLSYEYEKRSINKSIYSETPEFLGQTVLNNCDNTENLKVLEIGPGSGEIIKFFSTKGFFTVAVDISSKICDITKNTSPDTLCINNNVIDVNFSPSQFDIIYAGAVIHLFPLSEAEKLLRLINLWLKPNGVLFINTTTNSTNSEGFYSKKDYFQKIDRFRRQWTEKDFKKFVASYFDIVDVLFTDESDRYKRWIALICKSKTK